MKIAFLSTFYPFRGGIAQFNALLYRILEKEHETEAYTFKRQYPGFLFPGETQYVKPEDPADQIPSIPVLDSINPLSYIRTARKINRAAPDVILTKYWMTFFGFSLGSVLKRLNKKTKRISVLDNVIPHERRFFDDFANRLFLNNNEGFIVMSDAVLKDLLHYRPDARYLRVNHPVYAQFGEKIPELQAREILKLDPQKHTLLFFGLIRDYKGLDLLIEAVSMLDDSYQVVVGGECYGDFSAYETLLDRYAVRHRFHLYNRYISDAEVPLFFSAADVCVLPYKTATQSGVTAVSQHFGLPVIATDVGGLKETVLHGETGLIVARPEAALIAEQISDYFQKGLKASFSEAMLHHNEENSWDKFAEKVLRFIAEIPARS